MNLKFKIKYVFKLILMEKNISLSLNRTLWIVKTQKIFVINFAKKLKKAFSVFKFKRKLNTVILVIQV